MESKVRRGGPQEVVAYGHTYKSIVEFCNAYDLKYPNTSAQLRAGVEPEVVIENSGNLPSVYRPKAGPRPPRSLFLRRRRLSFHNSSGRRLRDSRTSNSLIHESKSLFCK